uniref:Elongator complex protein 4 n=1 Tax=Homalodisca liturata TaxID=320908 RepID=A0A1B6HED0_9HEMI
MELKFASKLNLKDDRKLINIPGTRVISSKDQLILSSGVISLDSLIGGGLQIGSILLIEEDEFGVFSKYLTKYFLAEGLVNKHCLFIGSLDCDVQQLTHELPCPVDYSDTSQSHSGDSSDELKIAWRYQNQPMVQSAPSTSTTIFGHNFDLTKPYPKDALEDAEIAYWSNADSKDPYAELLQELWTRIHKQGHSTQAAQPRRTALRVALDRLGSPLWPQVEQRLPQFLHSLRRLIQSAHATALVTLPTELLKSKTVAVCEHLCDNVIRLQSLANDPNPVFREYSGLLTVIKLATTNTLTSHIPETQDWAFKLRKRKFVIDKLHLPPELQETTQREQDETSGLSCARSTSLASALLDF